MLVFTWKARLRVCSLTLQETDPGQYQLDNVVPHNGDVCTPHTHACTHTYTQPQTNTRTPANPAWQNPGAKNNIRWRTDYYGSNL